MSKRLILEVQSMELLPMRSTDLVCSFGESTNHPAVAVAVGDNQALVVSFYDDQPIDKQHVELSTSPDPDEVAEALGAYLQELSDGLRGSATIADHAEDVLRKVNELWEVPVTERTAPTHYVLRLTATEKGIVDCALARYKHYLQNSGDIGAHDGVIALTKRCQDISAEAEFV